MAPVSIARKSLGCSPRRITCVEVADTRLLLSVSRHVPVHSFIQIYGRVRVGVGLFTSEMRSETKTAD